MAVLPNRRPSRGEAAPNAGAFDLPGRLGPSLRGWVESSQTDRLPKQCGLRGRALASGLLETRIDNPLPLSRTGPTEGLPAPGAEEPRDPGPRLVGNPRPV